MDPVSNSTNGGSTNTAATTDVSTPPPTTTPPTATTTTNPITTTTTTPAPTTTTPNPTTTTIPPSTTATTTTTTSIPTTSDPPTTSSPATSPSLSTSFSLISYTSNSQVMVSTSAVVATITPSPAGDGSGGSVSSGPNAAIIGGAVGGVVGFAAIVIAAWVFWIRRKNRRNGSSKGLDFFEEEDLSYERVYAPSPPPFASGSSKRVSMLTPSEGSHGYRDSISSNRMSTTFDELLDPRPLLMSEHNSSPGSSIKDPLSMRQNQRLRVLVGSGGSVIPTSSSQSSDEHKPDAASHSPDRD